MSVPPPPSVLPDISPSRGEIDKLRTPCLWNERVRHLISPLEGEMPGRAEGGKPHAPPSRCYPHHR
ncbi:hypothetical protein DXT96_23475 [Agrobacterium sp. ICMP 6402]|nr:hypothetical protein [Agrobacterium sp. ICMP 6402]